MISKQQIQIAREGILNYFANYSIKDILIGESTDVLDLDDSMVYDFTGLIGISGKYRGGMYVTCKTDFVRGLMKQVMGGDIADESPDLFADLVGEMANTLSGYYQKIYGDLFLISIPHVIIGKSEIGSIKVKLKQASFQIPFKWEGSEGKLVFSIEEV